MSDHVRPTDGAARRPADPFGIRLDRRTLLQAGGWVVGASGLALAAGCTPTTAPSPTTGATATTGGSATATWAPPSAPMAFPAGFRWGAATSAFQVEGSTTADGRGPSIWDTFAAGPGKIDGGATGDPAADHYRLWRSDLDLMSTLGLGAYRFSIAWPRVQPTGSGAVNPRGLDFYKNLLDGLLERGIHPAVTLYHWDLPQPLQDAGGWPARDTAARFSDYAAIVFDALGDRPADWFTINEPKTTAYVGYLYGSHAPGLTDPDAAVRAVHHQLLAHGLAVQAFRARRSAEADAGIGIALNLQPVYAAIGAEAVATRADAVENRLFLDPVLRGQYPTDAIGSRAGQLRADPATLEAAVQDGDLATISAPCNHLGVQYYGVAAVDRSGGNVAMFPTSDASWQQVHAEGFYETLMRIRDEYPAIPLVVTENGIPDRGTDGTLADVERREYLHTHLQQAARAIHDGVDLRGYYAWSLLDNFEWARGYTQRWGLVNVDFGTQERTAKDSAAWYRSVIEANAVPASE